MQPGQDIDSFLVETGWYPPILVVAMPWDLLLCTGDQTVNFREPI